MLLIPNQLPTPVTRKDLSIEIPGSYGGVKQDQVSRPRQEQDDDVLKMVSRSASSQQVQERTKWSCHVHN